MTRTEDERTDEDLDCVRVVLFGKKLGFTTEEVKRMRWGEFLDYQITANEMEEEQRKAMEEARKEEKKQEPHASLLDL